MYGYTHTKYTLLSFFNLIQNRGFYCTCSLTHFVFSLLTSSTDARSKRVYIQTIILPEHNTNCVVFEQVPWIGTAQDSSWMTGFVSPPNKEQGVKLNLINQTSVTLLSDNTISPSFNTIANMASMEMKGGNLIVSENASLRISNYISDCFDRTPFQPNNISVNNLKRHSFALSWSPPLLQNIHQSASSFSRVIVYKRMVQKTNIIQVLLTNSSIQHNILVDKLEANTTYWFTITPLNKFSIGMVSESFRIVTKEGLPFVPQNPCGILPQSSWMAAGSLSDDVVPWSDGFVGASLPLHDQSVHVNFIGDHRYVEIGNVTNTNTNTTFGSLQMFGTESRG